MLVMLLCGVASGRCCCVVLLCGVVGGVAV